MHWHQKASLRHEACQHVLRGAQQPDHADAHAQLRPPDQRLFKEGRKLRPAVALHIMYYNYVRIHKTLRVTPAMQAGVAYRLWSLDDVIAKIDELAPAPKPRGPYKQRVN